MNTTYNKGIPLMAYAWHPTSDAREPVKYATTYNKVFITQLYDRYHI